MYLRDHDPKYGPDIIADLVIPIGLPLIVFSSSLFLRIYNLGFWQAVTVFSLGVALVMFSMRFSLPLDAGAFVFPIIFFIILVCFGAVGFYIGRRFFNSEESDR